MAIQTLSFIVSIIGIIAWIAWAIVYKHKWLYAVTPLIWLLNAAVYYTFLFINIYHPFMSDNSLDVWNAIIHLHAKLIIVGAAVLMIIFRKQLKGNLL